MLDLPLLAAGGHLMAFDMSDYVDVAARLRDLFAKHPEASMRGTYELLTIGDSTFIAYRAECYRTPDDAAPGVGTAWEPVPGPTTYTKGSELQNAETSAWGRAIVAIGASESKRIASADEVRSARQNAESTHGERPAPPAVDATAGGTRNRNANKGRPDDASGRGGDAAPSSDGADSHDVGRAEAEGRPTVSQNQKQRIQARIGSMKNQNAVWQRAGEWSLPAPGQCSAEQLELWGQLLDTLDAPMAEASK